MSNQLLLKVTSGGFWYYKDKGIHIEGTNLGGFDLKFKSRPIFWLVKQISFTQEDQCLHLEVVDYNVKEVENWEGKEPKKHFSKIHFLELDWQKLEPLLSVYNASIKKRGPVINSEETSNSYATSIYQYNAINHHVLQSPVSNMNFEGSFSFPFEKITIHNGFISFQKSITEAKRTADFHIYNSHLLSEFDAVKSWFPKKLNTKTFTVQYKLTIEDGLLKEVIATSIQIDRIDENVIDSIKNASAKNLLKAPPIAMPDKTLFTADEVFDQFKGSELEGNIFKYSDEDLINILSEGSNIRNRKQLEYLSKMKHPKDLRLRFTLHPIFGYLFVAQGRTCNHFIWELLNSNATYMWSINKNESTLEQQLQKIDTIINSIRNSNRSSYLKKWRAGDTDFDITFAPIRHTDINSDLVDGFVKWKAELNERIV